MRSRTGSDCSGIGSGVSWTFVESLRASNRPELRFRKRNLRRIGKVLHPASLSAGRQPMAPLPHKELGPAADQPAELAVAGAQKRSVVTEAGLRQQRAYTTAITTAAAIISGGNVFAFILLPWSQPQLFGDTNPAVWISLGLLVPTALVCLSLYKAYWNRIESGEHKDNRLGPYLLKEKLGSGGMGEVYLAEHRLMKRHCAVKLIHPENASDTEMRDSFEREAKATAQLTHWNTIQIYDYGTSEDGRFYYVMEYLKGVNLWHYVKNYGPMPPGRVVYVLRQLCDALYEADCAGLVHRDIKPSNIFLTERGRACDVVKLLDFGLVQTISKNPIQLRNVSTKLHGSPSYMCPEQAVGLTPDCRGDLYSLGAVAYFLLTGHPPFVDDNPIMLVVAHATTQVPTFEEIGVTVPRDLSSIVLKCLARDPKDRFETARELREALELCDCIRDWSWKQAEDWWEHFRPTAPDAEPPSNRSCDTAVLDRDTSSVVPDRPQIDYEEPTLIIDRPTAAKA